MRLRHCHSIALVVILAFAATAAYGLVPLRSEDLKTVAKCKADLAKRLPDTRVEDINLISALPVTWPNGALGMPEPGRMYIQALTPGQRVILQARNTCYFYATSSKSIKYGGPVETWKSSLLFTKPVKNEPNLNGDLYQCSLLGTNCVRLASRVTDFYPQQNGAIIFTSRTSRSGFDLLYTKVGQSAKPAKLHSAFAFGGAAFNEKQDRWAALVKPRVGAWWVVEVSPTVGETKRVVISFPTDVKPEAIAWSGEKVMVLGKKGERMACLETTPGDAQREWKAVAACEFPLMPDYILNKSQTLDIRQLNEAGKPSVEVSELWFTGDRDVVATIGGLTMKGQTLLPYGFALIWGEKSGKPAVYTVDISTGEVIGAAGIGNNVKPFLYPPKTSPLAAKK